MRNRVLVVDDNFFHAEIVRILLTGAGFEVTVASGLEEARAAALRCKPDAVILDFAMPLGDGDLVLAALRAKPETAGVPVLFLSNWTRLEPYIGAAPNVWFMAKQDGVMPVLARLRKLLAQESGSLAAAAA